jgi:hypothetical protein
MVVLLARLRFLRPLCIRHLKMLALQSSQRFFGLFELYFQTLEVALATRDVFGGITARSRIVRHDVMNDGRVSHARMVCAGGVRNFPDLQDGELKLEGCGSLLRFALEKISGNAGGEEQGCDAVIFERGHFIEAGVPTRVIAELRIVQRTQAPRARGERLCRWCYEPEQRFGSMRPAHGEATKVSLKISDSRLHRPDR